MLNFKIEHSSALARCGKITFASEVKVETPVFMPVGTRGTVKAMWQQDLMEIGYKLILGNTYHLYLRPGTDILEQLGGLKKFISWPHALLTDSGGYQAFSLGDKAVYGDDGVMFRSVLDGSKHFFSPEKVVDIERVFGSDIVMPIDDCAPYPADVSRLKESLTRTHQWLKKSKEYFYANNYNEEQNLFGIVQGGIDKLLRKESANFCTDLDLPGYAIGGLSVGEKNDQFREALALTTSFLPQDKPRYLMGVGSVPEMLYSIAHGVDMFDCVLPTRNARNGQALSFKGKFNLRNEKWKSLDRPIDEDCECKVCKNYSMAYLRHLHKSSEILGIMMSTYHNLYFFYQLMQECRENIKNGTFDAFSSELSSHYEQTP